jgi:hypothetical protein
LPGVQIAQRLRLIRAASFRLAEGLFANLLERSRHALDEVSEPFGDVGMRSTEIVIVRRADRQRLIVILEIPRIVLFERIESLEVAGPEMQKERVQQTRRASVAVIMRVNRGVLVVRNAGLERCREIVFLVDPLVDLCAKLLHQSGDVPGL